ncbi:MAG: hypothetical protein Tp118SUR00d2C21406231_8 [Prokaryotic dsDNA virus sp.]|nr:MAG: hypothetical protein Tp125DCM00d2C40298531_27 [Prokaryotic dsDNA virus sp.]QDP53128.1 MAG: hypothetical protein Tp118SUR00d2C21406231_8 [Prokaryotic dsDNA virus sp.]|tara:strand:+ start:5002 stop:5655 length:654 start_codon:yes stop_codon:yes gene_type:complete
MAVTQTYTNNEICEDALRKIGVTAVDEDATAFDIDTAKRALFRLLKSWQNRDLDVWLKSWQTVTLTTAASYTLDPIRPMRIDQVNFKQSNIETPMTRLTREEYDSLPIKTTQGVPTTWYYDRQREAAKLYVWPVLAAASGQSLVVTYIREVEDIELTDAVDVPAEWYDALVYNLALRLMDEYGVQNNRIAQMAMKLEDEALAFDREQSIFFAGENAH